MRCIYLKIDNHHLSLGHLIGPVAECVWDRFVVLLDRGKAIIV